MSADVLGPEWHLSPDGYKILSEIVGEGQATNKQKVLKAALDVDLKNIGKSFLTNELGRGKTSKVILQIQKIRNISAPKANESSQAAPRMLKLTLTDGESYAQAIEIMPINDISRDKTPPGTKVVIDSAKIMAGYLLLSPQNCSVLGGEVPHMVEKWVLAKSIQQSRNRKASNDGAPPWVPFGSKIIDDNQEGAFKSLGRSENKDGKIENSEFDQQRQEAIAEASSTAVKKTFGGRARQNVQQANTQNRTFPDRGRKFGRGGGGQRSNEDYDASERPQKPAEKVSLFDFLSDKLPVTETKPQESNYYKKSYNHTQNTNNKQNYQRDNKYEKNNPVLSQTTKGGYNRGRVDEPKTEQTIKNYGSESQNKGQASNSNYLQQQKSSSNDSYHKNTNSYSDKGTYNKNNIPQKYNSNTSSQASTRNEIIKSQNGQVASGRNDTTKKYSNTQVNTPKNIDNKSYSETKSTSSTPNYDGQLASSKNDTSKKYSNTQVTTPKNINNKNYSDTKITSNSSNYNNSSKGSEGRNVSSTTSSRYGQSHQTGQNKYANENSDVQRNPSVPSQPPPNPNMNQVNQNMSKMSLNSEFAKRSLRNHLNIVPTQAGHQQSGQQRILPPQHPNGPMMMNNGIQMVPVVPVNNFVPNNLPVGLQVGQHCMAKYWEDGEFYNAIVTGVTDRTYVVKFRDYGNIEEIFKNDCFPASNQFHGNQQHYMDNQYQHPYRPPQGFNNEYIGKMEFKRRPNYNNS